jgi:diamine N-acetyltransferase
VTIALREVTKDNLRDILELKVAPEQERFVAPNAASIAQAYFDRQVAWFRAIYTDDTPVGFVMLYDDAAEQKYHLWRFMVDHRFQGQGYGAEALNQVIAYVRQRPGARVSDLRRSRRGKRRPLLREARLRQHRLYR